MSDEYDWEDEESEEEWYEEDSAEAEDDDTESEDEIAESGLDESPEEDYLDEEVSEVDEDEFEDAEEEYSEEFIEAEDSCEDFTEEDKLTTSDLIDENEAESIGYGNTWAVSLCFWLTLTVSGFLYGAVALSPKLAVWMSARHEFRENSRQLAALEEKVDYLERVCHALDTDPDFLQRMSQTSGAVIRSSDGSELIPVSGNLLFGYEDTATVANAVSEPTKSAEFARLVGSHRGLRTSLLLSASLLTIFAFTFLNDAGAGLVETTGRVVRWGVMLPIRRYMRDDGDEPPEDS